MNVKTKTVHADPAALDRDTNCSQLFHANPYAGINGVTAGFNTIISNRVYQNLFNIANVLMQITALFF